MTLKEFLVNKKIKISDVARDLDKRHCVVRKWAKGNRIPTAENMQRIFEYTGGLVTANDFYKIKEEIFK